MEELVYDVWLLCLIHHLLPEECFQSAEHTNRFGKQLKWSWSYNNIEILTNWYLRLTIIGADSSYLCCSQAERQLQVKRDCAFENEEWRFKKEIPRQFLTWVAKREHKLSKIPLWFGERKKTENSWSLLFLYEYKSSSPKGKRN